jgi:hypothetical protein
MGDSHARLLNGLSKKKIVRRRHLDLDAVTSGKVDDTIGAALEHVNNKQIIAFTACELITPRAAADLIIAVAAGNLIIATPASKEVVSVRPYNHKRHDLIFLMRAV